MICEPGYWVSASSSAVINIFVGFTADTVSKDAFNLLENRPEPLLILPIFFVVTDADSIHTT